MPDRIRIEVADHAQGERLVRALDGFKTAIATDREVVEVEVFPDRGTAAQLVQLFDTIGRWLAGEDDVAAEVHFGERRYKLVAPPPNSRGDPTTFLLERAIQLQTALDSRVVIEQAKGVLAERYALSAKAAFELLRASARSHRTKIHDVAAAVVASASGDDGRVPPELRAPPARA